MNHQMNNLQKLVLKDLNLHSIKVHYNDVEIDPALSFETQQWSYKEDLLQASIVGRKNKKYIIDIGWYPEFEPKGSFTVEVIKGIDWDNPLFIKKTNEYYEMKKYLQEALDYVKDLRD